MAVAGVNPMAETRAQIALERERERIRRENERKALEAKKRADAATATTAERARTRTKYRAGGYDNQQIAARGIDRGLYSKFGVDSLYDMNIENMFNELDPMDTTPTLATSNAFKDALDVGNNRYRNETKKEFTGTFGDNYSMSQFGDTADDAVLNILLGKQEGEAKTYVDAAQKRGTLNTRGYDTAMRKLAEQRAAGMAKANQIGSGVISGYRGQLDNLRNNSLTTLGTSDLTNPFDIRGATRGLQTLRNSLNSRLRGDVTAALDGQSFFDPSMLIAKAGSLQGISNPSLGASSVGGAVSPLMSAFTQKKSHTSPLNSARGNGVF